MNQSHKLNVNMTCLECGKDMIRKAGNQKFCVLCSMELNRKRDRKKYEDRRIKYEQTRKGS